MKFIGFASSDCIVVIIIIIIIIIIIAAVDVGVEHT